MGTEQHRERMGQQVMSAALLHALHVIRPSQQSPSRRNFASYPCDLVCEAVDAALLLGDHVVAERDAQTRGVQSLQRAD